MYLRLRSMILVGALLTGVTPSSAQTRIAPPTIHRNPVLILIEGDRFEPKVDPDSYVHPTWVRWPAVADESGSNRLMSLVTGVDWQMGLGAFNFAAKGSSSSWQARNVDGLIKAGWFEARRDYLGKTQTFLVADSDGNVQRAAQALALDDLSGRVEARRLYSRWPEGALGVMSARSGDDVAAAVRSTTGRVLVIEYPPPAGENWSRLWLLGRNAWPSGVPVDRVLQVPGLVPSTEIGRLLVEPESVEWRSSPPHWVGANRWMEAVQRLGPVFGLALGVPAGLLVMAAAWFAAQERSGVWLVAGFRSFLVLPAAVALGGNIAEFAGLGSQWVWIFLVLAALVGIGAVLARLTPKPCETEPLYAAAAVAFVGLAVANPVYSLFSASFARSTFGGSGFYLGAMATTFFVAVRPMTEEAKSKRLTAAAAALFFLLVASRATPLTGRESLSLIQDLAWCFAGVSWAAWAAWRSTWVRVVAGAIAILRFAQLVWFGCTFLPNGLIRRYGKENAVNLFDWVTFALSPSFVATVFVFAGIALFSSPFLQHRVVNAWRGRTVSRRVCGLAGFLALGGLWSAPLLDAALVAFWTAGLVILESLIRAEPPL